MSTDYNLSGDDSMLHISKALLGKAQAALDKAENKNAIIKIEGTPFVICPRDKQPTDGFEPIGFLQRDGSSYAFGPHRAA